MFYDHDEVTVRSDFDVPEATEPADQRLVFDGPLLIHHISPEIVLRERRDDHMVAPLWESIPTVEEDTPDAGGRRPIDRGRSEVGGIEFDAEFLRIRNGPAIIVETQ